MNDSAAHAPALSRPGPTTDLAGLLARLRIGAIDAFAKRAATRHLIDTLGAIIAGATQEVTGIAERVLGRVHGTGAVAVPGFSTRYDLLTAAYLGGTAGHGLELDDGYRSGSVHPGTVVVPAAWALAADRRASGAVLLTAVVAGYEAMCRIAAAAHPRSRWRGFHNTGIAGTFGGAAAGGVLLGFDATRMEAAFGTAASSSAGLFSFLAGGDVKRTHPGHAAREGLLAALLTAEGLAAPNGVLEFKEGFFRAFAGDEKDPASIDILHSGDNNPHSAFAVANCYMKPYACCRHIHSAIDGVLKIVGEHDLAPEQVARMDFGTYAVAASHAEVGWSEMTTAQMSFPFVIAATLVRRRASLHEFGAEERTNGRILAQTGKVHVHVDPECDADYPRKRAAKTRLETTDGQVFEAYMPEPYGAASNPLSDAALEEKFVGLAAPVLGAARAQAALAALWDVEHCEDIGALAAMLMA
jgi:2-methylcitrate dehydratase PrpD